jgi:iron complex transport system substrate-binding protein
MKLFFVLLFSINLFAYERIIALSPSINEIVYALGSGDKIVANTEFCNYPLDAKNKTKVGGYFNPNIEKMLELKPDIVLLQKSSIKLSKQLNKLGIKTQVFSLTTLKDIRSTIKTIGDILNKKAQAKTILHKIDIALQNTKDIIEDKKILIVIGHPLKLDKRVFVVGDNLYMDEIITLSGNKNAYAKKGGGQPILNMENIIATNPDIVIVLAPYKKEKKLTSKQLISPWLQLPISAAKTKSIYILDKEYSGIASHRLEYYLQDFTSFLQDAKTR